jgi:hypothetical protein
MVNKEFGASEIVVTCCIGLHPHISIIIITVIIMLVTGFVQGIYNYVPEKKHVSRV